MQKSDSIQELMKALLLFQNDLKQPAKTGKNSHFKSSFVPLEAIVETINQHGKQHGLTFTQWPISKSGAVTSEGSTVESIGVATMVMHSQSGEWIEYDPVFVQMEKNTVHSAGGIISYLRRYSLSCIFGITSDDEDEAAPNKPNNGQQQGMRGNTEPYLSQQQTNEIVSAVKTDAQRQGKPEQQIYQEAMSHCRMDPNKQSNSLTAREAAQLINYFKSKK